MRARCRLVGFAVSATALAAWISSARAAGPLGTEGQPIQTSAYEIDMFQGPVLASSRVTGLAGAYAPIAEGVDGFPVNAAAPAVRMPWSYDWFDYDLGFGVTFPGAVSETDFDNNGTVGFHGLAADAGRDNQFLFVTLGGNLQLGSWGFGASVDVQSYRLGREKVDVPGAPPNLVATFTKGHALVAKAFLDGQLVVGAGVRLASLALDATENVNGSGSTQELFSLAGAGVESGALWAPHGLPVRVGICGRTPVKSEPQPDSPTQPNADGDTIVGTRYLPSSVTLPWEVEAGIAVQLGPRPLNVPWVHPDELRRGMSERMDRLRMSATPAASLSPEAEKQRQALVAEYVREELKARYRRIPRPKLLLTAAVLASGNVQKAVSVESFLLQRVERSGRSVTATPRVGVELEPIIDWLQARAGTYLEPSRFRNGHSRVHGTAGFDLKVLSWSVFGLFDDDTFWRVSGTGDVSRGYFAWGAAAGVWH